MAYSLSPGALDETNISWDVGLVSEQTPLLKAQITTASVSEKCSPRCRLIWARTEFVVFVTASPYLPQGPALSR